MSFSQRSLRGQGRGRGRGRGRAWYPKPLPTAPSGPKGPTIDSIDIKALLIEDDAPEIANVEYIASYNWLDSTVPTVLVPGENPPCRCQTCDQLLARCPILMMFHRRATCLDSAERGFAVKAG